MHSAITADMQAQRASMPITRRQIRDSTEHRHAHIPLARRKIGICKFAFNNNMVTQDWRKFNVLMFCITGAQIAFQSHAALQMQNWQLAVTVCCRWRSCCLVCGIHPRVTYLQKKVTSSAFGRSPGSLWNRWQQSLAAKSKR